MAARETPADTVQTHQDHRRIPRFAVWTKGKTVGVIIVILILLAAGLTGWTQNSGGYINQLSPARILSLALPLNATEYPSNCSKGFKITNTTRVHSCTLYNSTIVDIRRFPLNGYSTIIGVQLTLEEFEAIKSLE